MATKPYRVGVLGNCCTHGEFVVAGLRAQPQAELAGGWEPDPRRGPALAAALGTELRRSADEYAGAALLGVEVLMAAYRYIVEEGRPVELPLEDGSNPLIGSRWEGGP